MKKATLISSIIFLFSACVQNDASKETKATVDTNNQTMQQHTILFYNTENLFDTFDDKNNPGDDEFTPNGFLQWDKERYTTKLKHLAEAIFEANDSTPLLVGLAEVENRKVVEDLFHTEVFVNSSFKVAHFNSPDRRGIDCALAYNADKFDVIEETVLRVKMPNNRHFTTRDILYVKGKLNNKEELNVFVCHWSSRREGRRETEPRRVQAAKILRQKVDEILAEKEDGKIVIMGDFNDTPVNKSVHDVLKAKAQHELQKGDLVNLLIEEQKTGEGTSVYKRDWDVLDQLIVSRNLLNQHGALSVEGNDAHILKTEKLLYTYRDGGQKPNQTYGGPKYFGGYSDHLPVYLILNEK